ncbi:hypothetical protein Ae201684P_002236 [Aphanomyces euteiches]|nr:hypothetical protein Ae201684P_002236 [Aphanomyces euteiches]
MLSIGFVKSKADHCIYIKRQDEDIILVSLYVDDLILASNSDEMMQTTKIALSKRFKMTDLGPLGSVFIHQSKFLKSVLTKFYMQDCKPVNAVGCLMYLMVATRPDIAVAVATSSIMGA